MSSDSSQKTVAPNRFTQGSLIALFAKTALPVIFVMGMNGLLTVVDAIFLGTYVGPDALAAVTIIFPIYMLIVALSTLVSSGMSSILARHLGAGHKEASLRVFAGAHGLALTVSVLFITLFVLFGRDLTDMISADHPALAEMGFAYLRINIFASPLLFSLALHSDALRNEGLAILMAAMSLAVSLANILFNYLLIVHLDFGVEGSAYGTVAAQAVACIFILFFRTIGPTELRPRALLAHSWAANWSEILKLGAPQSLNFLGMSIVSSATIAAIQIADSPNLTETLSAFGIITRVMTFFFLPLLGLSHAFQSITGNNFGARLWERTNRSLGVGMAISFVYCLIAQILLTSFAAPVGTLFVADQMVVQEVARIVPMMIMMMFITGPLMMIASFFQAIGDASRAAILGLSKAYLFMLPLLFALPMTMGERGIWHASPVAELMLAVTTILVLFSTARKHNRKWGLLMPLQETNQ